MQLNAERIAAPLRWWRDGLAACVADRSAARLLLAFGARGEVVVRGTGYASLEAFLASHRGDALRRAGVVIGLPAEDLLVMPVELPLAAAKNLGEVLRYEMDRYTPFSAKQVYDDHRVTRRDTAQQRVHAELAVVRRERVDPLLQALEAQGIPVLAVQGDGLWSGCNLLPAQRRQRRGWTRANRTWLLAATAALMLLAIAVTPLLQARAQVVRSAAELAAVRRQADDVLELRRRLEQRRTLAQAVVEYGNGRRPVIDVVRELTHSLPDDTWLQGLDLQGGKVEIQGESSHATDLIALLESSDQFHNVSFRAPLLQVRNKDKERFAITLELVEGRP